MRIKMKTLMSFLAMLVGIFMIGDLFLFSSVGKHPTRASRSSASEEEDTKSPYNLGQDVKFLKRQIKSGREYLSEGIKSLTGKRADGEAGVEEDMEGLRENILGAMDVPGMQQKFLPVEAAKQDDRQFSDGLSKFQELEKELMEGTLHEEDINNADDEVVIDDEQDDESPTDGTQAVSEHVDKSSKFQWGSLFGFGNNKDSKDAEGTSQNEQRLSYEGQDSVRVLPDNNQISMDSLNVPGMDNRILSKLNFQQPQEDNLFHTKDDELKSSQEEPKPTEEQLENEWLYSQLKDIKGLADSVPQWSDSEPEQSLSQSDQSQTSQQQQENQGRSAYGFFASLFQPLQFAGSTGDDQEDGGWASVEELDNLADSVQRAIVPGMQQKVLALDSGAIEVKPVQPYEGFESVPGLGDNFFKKYSQGGPVMPGVPDGSEQQQNAGSFLSNFLGGGGEAPVAQGQSYSGPIQVPNIPGLSEGFLQKYGDHILPDEPQPSYQQATEDDNMPEVPSLSMDFFNKFIHPVAEGQAALPQSDGMLVESLEEVPGLPEDFFEKYVKQREGSEESLASKEDLENQGFNIEDIPGLSNYLDQYSKDSGEPVIPLEALKESLRQAQVQVPGLPGKILRADNGGMAGDLSEFVPPSGLPALGGEQATDADQQSLFTVLLKAFSRNPATGNTGVLPYMPMDGESPRVPYEPTGPSEAGGTAETVPEWPPKDLTLSNQTGEGFKMRGPDHPSGLNMDELIHAMVPNVTDTKEDAMKLDDARAFLNQLEGVVLQTADTLKTLPKPTKGNLADDLANITALEDSRVVQCNLTKSPLWKVAITDRWHTVKDGLMFVYSSYLDDRIRGHTAIRILGILEGWEVGMHLKPYCQIWFQDKNEPFVMGATYEWLPGQPIAKFKAVLITCVYQTNHVVGKPLAVSLTTEPCEEPQFLVKIHTRNETAGIKKTNFTICLTGPMKFGYADVGQFIQWMEFNIMMGVERFVLYNHSMDAALRPYLVHYAKMGYVQLFPWVIPENIPNPLVFLKNLGHLAMINDCLYRNMWTSKYVVFMDIDEMIMPRYGHTTFGPMIKNAGCDTKPQALVQSVFFRREWPNDELFANNSTIVNMGLVGLLKTKRERKIWPPYMRSKYFIKPEEVLITNVHAAHSFLSGLDYQDLSCIFNPKEVIMHHYRYWGEVTGNYVVDRRLHEYGEDLINRATRIYEAVLGQKVT